MDMPRDDFIMGMGYTDERTAYLFIGVSHRFHQGAMGGSFNSFFHEVASHGNFPDFPVDFGLRERLMSVEESTHTASGCQGK